MIIQIKNSIQFKLMMRKEILTFGSNDRYIVNRNNIDFEQSYLLLNRQDASSEKKLEMLTKRNIKRPKVLHSKIHSNGKISDDLELFIIDHNGIDKPLKNYDRRFRRYPIDIIQARNASTQFIDNILDVSNKNMNAIALNNYIFLWDLNTNTYLSYEKNRTTPFTSLSWKHDGNRLGMSKKHCLDILGGRSMDTLVRSISIPYTFCSMSWRNEMITCGSNRSVVLSYDLRNNNDKPAFSLCAGKEKKNNPVVSVQWNPNGRYLATSEPLNNINIWDILNLKTPLTTFKKHKSAVKGLAWCPYETGSLASGGGYFDGNVYVWNCNNGKVSSSASLNSQITGILWSKGDRELLTAHARRGQNNEEDKYLNSKIHFWKYLSSKGSSGELQKLNHSLCNTEEVISITSNERFFLALCGFNCPKLYLWEKIFNKVPPALVKLNLTDVNKFR